MDSGKLLQKWTEGCSIVIAFLASATLPSFAQITQVAGDSTVNTLVNGNLLNTCTSGLCQVTGGTQVGNSLFHSFELFSVGAGDEVSFVGTGIDSIFTRVTGASSFIDGTISTTTGGVTDLFLLNPQGILFGENATLDIDGSFIVTTADSIEFNNGAVFGVDNTTPELLSISIPVGLQYGASPGAIEVQGPGHQMSANPFTGEFDRTSRPSGLAVDSGQSLLLLGGDITLVGGNLTAQDGHIELGSVTANQSSSLSESSSGIWGVTYEEGTSFQDIRLESASSLETSGNSGGSIQVYGQQLSLTDGSVIAANTLGIGNSGGINVDAESITIQGAAGPVVSGIYSDAEGLATGQAGNVTVQSQQLSLLDEGKISSVTLGAGNTGNISVQADEQLVMQGSTFIVSSVLPFAPGNIGDIKVVAGQLTLSDGAQVATSNFGTGSAGELRIEADSILLAGVNIDNPAFPLATGFQALGFLSSGGQLIVDAGDIQILDGAKITADTFGPGDGGNVVITAEQLDVVGGNSQIITPSSVSTSVLEGATGQGGDLTLVIDQLRLVDGGQIGITTFGEGDAGTLSLVADQVDLSGLGQAGRSGLFSNAIVGTGNGGGLTIEADRVNIQNGAIISASNFQSLDLLLPGQGSPGNISIDANHLALNNGGSITADTLAGDQGNLTLLTDTLTLQQGSSISTNAQGSSTGGNILINAIALIATTNSDISANAQQGAGGRIIINANLILGTAFRDQLTSDSDITASSELGATFSGSVELNTPEYEADNGLAVLPTSIVDNSQQVSRRCTLDNENSFVVSGRGGTPTTPDELLKNATIWTDVRLSPNQISAADITVIQEPVDAYLSGVNLTPSAPALVEAQDIAISNGTVRLVAPSSQAQIEANSATICSSRS